MKKHLFLILCVLSSLLTIGCSSDEEGGSKGGIYGIVTTIGEPLKGIGVSLYESNKDGDPVLLLKTVTYEDGSYEFNDLNAGYYRLEVDSEEFEAFSVNVFVEGGRIARSDIKLAKKSSIYGIVRTEKEPLKDIGVSLYKIDQNTAHLISQTITSESGSYEFNKLNAGDYRLEIESSDFEFFSTRISIKKGKQTRADITLSPKNTYLIISTLQADILENEVQLKGSYKYHSIYYPHEYGFYYSKNSEPIKEGIQVVGTSTSNNNFVANIPKQGAGTYYFQAYAKNSIGITYGDVLSFTLSGSPVIRTHAASDVTEKSAILNGEIIYSGDPKITEKGFVYSTETSTPTLQDGIVVKVSGSTEGKFSYKLPDLIIGKTYYVRSYATSATRSVYGEVIKFVCEPDDYVILSAAGIMVQEQDLGEAEYSEATAMCRRSSIGGYSDWRLPTLSELNVMGANTEKIGNLRTAHYWSSTFYGLNDDDFNLYYTLIFYKNGSNSISHQDVYSTCRIRAVRTITE